MKLDTPRSRLITVKGAGLSLLRDQWETGVGRKMKEKQRACTVGAIIKIHVRNRPAIENDK